MAAVWDEGCFLLLFLILIPPWPCTKPSGDVRHRRLQVQPGSLWFAPSSPREGSCLAPTFTLKGCGLSLARGALTCPLSPSLRRVSRLGASVRAAWLQQLSHGTALPASTSRQPVPFNGGKNIFSC